MKRSEDILKIIQAIKKEYEQDRDDTAWYLNTANCVLDGKLDEIRSLEEAIIDDGGEFCYLGGRIDALETVMERYRQEYRRGL